MSRYIVTAAVQGRRAGEMLDDAQHPAQVIASLAAAGVLVALPNAPVEASAAQAVAAYASGAGDDIANSLMTAGLVRGVGGLAAKGRKVLWSNGDGDAKTWADVMSIVALSPLGPDVVVWARPDSAQSDVPPGSYDFRYGKFFSPYTGAGGNNVRLASAHLKNVGMIVGAQLHFSSGHSTLEWTAPDPGNVLVLLLMFGGSLQNDDGPTAIPVRLANGDNPLIIGGLLGGGITANAGPIVSLGPGAILWTITIDSTTGPVVGPNTVVSDDASAIMIHAHDGSFADFPANPGFLGTQLNIPLTSHGGSGPTTARPSAALHGGILPPGWTYYDTTIDKPIVVNVANAWVDYAGNPV